MRGKRGEEDEEEEEQVGGIARGKKGTWAVEGRVSQEWDIYSKTNELSEACILIKESNRINRKIPM